MEHTEANDIDIARANLLMAIDQVSEYGHNYDRALEAYLQNVIDTLGCSSAGVAVYADWAGKVASEVLAVVRRAKDADENWSVDPAMMARIIDRFVGRMLN